jgi:superfamily I DNA/RNA helicase/Zn-dependent peptidase ImmA (M78 family)
VAIARAKKAGRSLRPTGRTAALFIGVGLSLRSFLSVFWSPLATDSGSLWPRGLFSKREYCALPLFNTFDEHEAKDRALVSQSFWQAPMDLRSRHIASIAHSYRDLALGAEKSGRLCSAQEILDSCDLRSGLDRIELPENDPLLAGSFAVLDRDAETIWLSSARKKPWQFFDSAHEYGHFVLHEHGQSFRENEPPEDIPLTAEPQVDSLILVEGYSPKEREERDANFFAIELLLPCELAHRFFYQEHLSAADIAQALGLPISIVRAQFSNSVLAPEIAGDNSASDESIRRLFALKSPDETKAKRNQLLNSLSPMQRNAAEHVGSPYLLNAGPGTGKTRTLAARCAFLVETVNVASESILALTFSRRAAEEMQVRLIENGIGSQNAGPWVGTFHSFGLELIRRYGERAGLASNWRLIESREALKWLQSKTPPSNLFEHDPNTNRLQSMRDSLRAISRAKDELISPETYLELALKEEKRASSSPSDRQIASRTVAIAQIYLEYEQFLKRSNLIDVSDLIVRSVALLADNSDIAREVHARYPYVLADEYQDVNYASVALLKLLAGPNLSHLWVVGDKHQSIYRFRGASPENMDRFEKDFPGGARGSLNVNYRSAPEIVGLLSMIAGQMDSSSSQAEDRYDDWTSAIKTRDLKAPPLLYAVAADDAAQGDGICDAVFQNHSQLGIRYSDHAILCRTHWQADSIALLLARRGAPALAPQKLIDHPAVKDLLALILASISSSSSAVALYRIAQIQEFGFTKNEAANLARSAASSGESALKCLASFVSSLSDRRDESKVSLEFIAKVKNLYRVLSALFDENDPAALMERFLFQESSSLVPSRVLLASSRALEIARSVRLVAIKQIISLARSFSASASAQKQPRINWKDRKYAVETSHLKEEFLEYLAELEQVGDSPLVDLDEAAGSHDAVRILTVHSAKGSEFPIVFLPNLNENRFPPHDRPKRYCDFLRRNDKVECSVFDALDEEKRLFFVALSRAGKQIVVSRVEKESNHDKPLAKSILMDSAIGPLKSCGVRSVYWKSKQTASPKSLPNHIITPADKNSGSIELVDTAVLEWTFCPKRYFYEREIGLKAVLPIPNDEIQSKILVDSMSWLRDQWSRSVRPTLLEALNAAEKTIRIPSGKAGKEIKQSALEILSAASEKWLGEGLKPIPEFKTMSFLLDDAGKALASPSFSGRDREGFPLAILEIVRPIRENDPADSRIALYRAAMREALRKKGESDSHLRIELRSLSTGRGMTVPESTKWERVRIRKYRDILPQIREGRFPAKPAIADSCPQCSFFEICDKRS